MIKSKERDKIQENVHYIKLVITRHCEDDINIFLF